MMNMVKSQRARLARNEVIRGSRDCYGRIEAVIKAITYTVVHK